MATKFDATAREILVGMMMEAAEAKGWAVERVNDYGSVAVEVVDGDESRWMVVKMTAPKLADKDGNELWTIDEAMEGYADRVRKDKERADEKARKEAEKEAKRAQKEAEKANK